MLCFCPDALKVYWSDDDIYSAADLAFSVSYLELAQIGITGPGVTTTGGGFIGGGFGAVGALEGMAIASALNALTTVSKIHTFISITTNIGELNFHYGTMEPGALRIALARVFTLLRRLDPAWRQERLATLLLAQSEGSLTQVEFDRLSQRLATSTQEPRANQVTSAGYCPSGSLIFLRCTHRGGKHWLYDFP